MYNGALVEWKVSTMRLLKRLIITIIILLVSVTTTWAAAGFIIRRIQIEGLHRVSEGTVLTYLPIKSGQRLTNTETPNIIKALYNTGFFNNVSLYRDNNDLIIKVIERSTIGTISFAGNKKIATKKLTTALTQEGIQSGLVFNHSSLANLRYALLQQYYNLGRYDAKVTTSVFKEARNRVGIKINIYEGQVAKIRQIQVIGNRTFSNRTLINQFKLSTPNLFSFITHNDQYSREKLDGDLERLRSFYMDRGYIRFEINSTQVSITPDKSSIFITIHITEGAVYHLTGFKLAGKLLGKEPQLLKMIQLHKGDVFSRKKVVDIQTHISNYFANRGYAFATVDAIPTIDDKTKQVFITFEVNPQKIVYINRITFSGNVKTADYVLRREMRLAEGSPYSRTKIQESKRRLNMLGYITDVQVNSEPVPGTNNQVNLNYKVKDRSSATANLMAGYSDFFCFLFGANIDEKNYLGTGKEVGLGFQRSQYSQTYSFDYFNPYYTINGISRGFSIYYQKYTPGQVNLTPYTTDIYGTSLTYGIPITEKSSIDVGAGYEHTRIGVDSDSGQTVTNFINERGNRFNATKLMTSYNYVSYDRGIFPTNGFMQTLSGEIGVPVFNKHLDYYKLTYLGSAYLSLGKGFIFNPHTNLGYGNGYSTLNNLPFFYNYYAGGIGTVRGYEGNTLGPKDPQNGDSMGGNVLTTGSLELIVPNGISQVLRTSIFLDAGNVYQNHIELQNLRYAAGVDIQWLIPLLGAPLEFSFGKALNAKSGDDTQFFQFSIATGI